jgi:cytosine/adenosine deaminase-related metal-dependent hydrolase
VTGAVTGTTEPATLESGTAATDRAQPGFVNAHTHLYSGLVPLGMPVPAPAPCNFVEILQRVWWRLDRALDLASLRASARYYVAHALLAGTTTLIDHHESPRSIEGSLDVLADACQELGARAVLCYGATERNGGRAEGRAGLNECRRFAMASQRPLVRGLMGLHASFTVSDDTIREAAALCGELALPLHVHLAEDQADRDDARRRGYEGPLQRLIALDALPRGSILAHGVHLTHEEVRQAAERGAWLVQNPRSNRGNRVGYPKALGESPRIALGTDGYPSNLQAEAAALHAEALAHGEPTTVARERLEGSRALAAAIFGPQDIAADSIAFREGGIAHVTVAGRPVVSDGELLSADLPEIEAHAREQAARLWQRMGAL